MKFFIIFLSSSHKYHALHQKGLPMRLDEITSQNNEPLLETACDLIRYCRHVYKKGIDGDDNSRYKAANYIAFLMAYKNLENTMGDATPLHIKHFLAPGMRTPMKALQHYAQFANDDPEVMKMVKKLCTKMMNSHTGERFFNYQCDKLDKYFNDKENQQNGSNKTTTS